MSGCLCLPQAKLEARRARALQKEQERLLQLQQEAHQPQVAGTEETVLTQVVVPEVVVPEGGVEEQVSKMMCCIPI